MPDVPLNEILWLVAAILAAGVATGVLAGLFGIGGGAVIVPVLYEVFRVVGVGIGAAAAALAPSAVFRVAFAAIALFIALKTLFGRDDWRLGDELPGRALMSFYGCIVGLFSSLMGVSGGATSNLILLLYGKPIRNAVATSSGVGVPITIAGTVGYMLAGWQHQALTPPLSIGFVSVIGVLLMAPVSSAMAIYGVRLAHRIPRRGLEIAFGVFLLLASARFIVSLF